MTARAIALAQTSGTICYRRLEGGGTMMKSMVRTAIGVAIALAACTGGTTPSGDAGDTSVDIGGDRSVADVVNTDAPADLVTSDTQTVCAQDLDCTDSIFCNGAERCMPGAAGASANGCVAGTAACGSGSTCDEANRRCVTSCPDADGDGHREMSCGGDDCDDNDARRFPGNPETCDSHDEDCDPATLGADADHDGFMSLLCCNAGVCGTDCDDTRSTVHPTAVESCNGVDDDCDNTIDNGVQLTFYRDIDGDGYGQNSMSVTGCSLMTGYAFNGNDCDDMAPATHPGATDSCNMIDDDCDGTADPGCSCTDGQTQPCGDPDSMGGFLSAGICRVGVQTCAGGVWGTCVGEVRHSTEVCNMIDDDCDGVVDDGVDVECYIDADNDGFAPATAVVQRLCPSADPARVPYGRCEMGYTARVPADAGSADCADSIASVSPRGIEVCNNLDDDCNGMADDGTGAPLRCYPDNDGDGYAPMGSTATAACVCPTRTTSRAPSDATSSDCDDTNANAHPGLAEACDVMNIDENCNGMRNEGCGCTPGTTRACTDPGVCSSGVQSCISMGSTAAWGPCSITPSAESCNGQDDDCDGSTDESFPCARGATQACTRTCGGVMSTGTQTCLNDCSGWSTCSTAEVCNGCDDDLDGATDNGFVCALGTSAACTTSCGTSGTQPCNATCGGYDTCRAAMETCNFCDDVGDGGDDRAVGSTQTLSTLANSTNCGTALVAAGSATCYVIAGFTAGQSGTISQTTNTRVGYDVVSATATMNLFDDTSDSLAPTGSATLALTNGSAFASMRRSVTLTWNVGATTETVQIAQTIGATTTTLVTWSHSVVAWPTFDAGNISTRTIVLRYRTALDGAGQQVQFSIDSVTSPWTTVPTTTATVFPPGTGVRTVVGATIGTGPWQARLPVSANVQTQALLSCR